MKRGRLIFLINLGILIVYSIPNYLQWDSNYSYISLGLVIIAQASLNVMAGITSYLNGGKDKEQAPYFFGSAGWILLIGFSSCFGVGMILNGS